MAAPTPAQLQLDRHCLIVLQSVLRAAAPQEGCALLVGARDTNTWKAQCIWPCRNSWPRPAERHKRFAIDPREQLLAQKWARARNLEILGTAHSHPRSAAMPSRTDQRLCLKPCLMLIADPALDLYAWWIPEEGDPWAIAIRPGEA